MKLLRYISVIVVALVAIFTFANHASAAGNVYGYAYSDSLGWISMNCDNSALGAGYNINTCSTADYGVTLDMASGDMTGYGWSTLGGWIHFNALGTTPSYSENRLGSARVSGVTLPGVRPVTGWARFCSNFTQASLPDNCASGNTITGGNGGWNGWVSMLGDGSAGGVRYGVTFDTTTSAFDGFAWGGTVNNPGSEVSGWISFKGVTTVNVINPSKTLSLYIKPDISGSYGTTPVTINSGETVSLLWKSQDPITNCRGYSDQGVPNWAMQVGGGNGGGTAKTLPPPESGVAVFGPQTNYFVICTVAGIPNQQSNTVTAFIKNGGQEPLTLLGHPTGLAGSTSSFSVTPGNSIVLEWSSNTEMSSCSAIAVTSPAAGTWQTGQTKPDLVGPSFTADDLDIAVPTNPTIYQIQCTNGSGNVIVSNKVTVNTVSVPQDLVLEIKTDDVTGSYSTADVYVPQTAPATNVALRWYSPSAQIAAGTCRSSSFGSVSLSTQYWSSAPLSNPTTTAGTAPSVNAIDLDRADNAATDYTVSCTKTDGTPISKTVRAISLPKNNATPELTISGPTCVKNAGVAFDLTWKLQNGDANGNLTLFNTDSDQVWTGTSSPGVSGNVTRSNIHLANSNSGTYSLKYVYSGGPTIVVDHPMRIDPDCTQPPKKNWFFRFFER